MAAVEEIYGSNYNLEACYQRLNYSAKVLAINIAEMNFKIRHDSQHMWDGNNMKPDAIHLLIDKVHNINQSFSIQNINKTDKLVNMFPYLINGAVEYFRIVDLKRKRIYLIYITPSNIEAY